MPRQIIHKRRRMRLGLRQKAALIDLVEENFQFAAGKHPTASNKNARWRNIALTLNKIGPVYKTTDEWRSAFNGMKGKLKEKIKRIRDYNIRARLGGRDTEDSEASNPDSSDGARLSTEDYRIIKICRIKGLDELEQIGGNISTADNSTTSYTTRISTPVSLASIKPSPIASTSSKKTRKKVIPSRSSPMTPNMNTLIPQINDSADLYLSQGRSSPMAPNINTSITQINDSSNEIRRRVRINSDNPAVALASIKSSPIASTSSKKPQKQEIPSANQYLSQGRSSPMAPNINFSIPQIKDCADEYLSQGRSSPMAPNINTSITQIIDFADQYLTQGRSSPMAPNINFSIPQIKDCADEYLSQGRSSPMAPNINFSIPQIKDCADENLSQGRISPMAPNINTSIPQINDFPDQYLTQGTSSSIKPNINTSIPQINICDNEMRNRVGIYSENPAVTKSLRLQEENNRNQLIMITVLKQIVDKQQTIIDLMQKQS